MRLYMPFIYILILLASAGCGTGDAPPEREAGAGTATGAMQEMTGMQGARRNGMGAMQSEAMMHDMHAHMDSVSVAAPEQMRSMLATHRQMTANMIAQMNREMADMQMPETAEWNALVDSLRADLRTMPDMSAAELSAFMPQHRARVTRLMEMHEDMLRRMR